MWMVPTEMFCNVLFFRHPSVKFRKALSQTKPVVINSTKTEGKMYLLCINGEREREVESSRKVTINTKQRQMFACRSGINEIYIRLQAE